MTQKPAPKRTALTTRQWRAGMLLSVAYVAAMRLTAAFFSAPGLVFPAAGIALGALVLEGFALWPFILAAAAVGYLLNGSTLLVVVLMPFVHLLQALFGAWCLRKLRLDPLFRKPSDVFGFLVVAFVMSAIVPTLGSGVLYLNAALYGAPDPGVTWVSWYVAILASIVIVAPFVIRWFAKPHFTRTFVQWAEIALTLGFLAALSYLVFWSETSAVFGISLVYFLLVPLFWTALRLTPRFMTLSLLLMSVIALSGLFYGPFGLSGAELGTRLFQMEIFLVIISIIFLIQVVLEEQRRIALKLVGTQVETLRAARDELASETRAKSDFIAVIAHELRNPIAPIESSIDLLRAMLPEKHAGTLDMMRDRMNVVKRLLDDMLDMSRVAKNKLSIRKERFDLVKLVRKVVASSIPRLAERRQKLVLEHPDDPLEIDGDPVRLEQVVTNLITNASKFSDEGDTVTVAVRAGAGAEIAVRDEGVGIDPSAQDKIFDPFQQVEEGERTRKGIGIGLALVKSLVELHGGSVAVESEGRGRGSEFTVRLPLARGEAATQGAARAGAPESRSAKGAPAFPASTVLIVDDNDAAAWGVGKLLELSGCTVAFAYDGEQAIERAAETRPDIILLDIGLPDMTGYQVAKALRANGFAGTLVALTGYAIEDSREEVREAGFDDYLTKPVGLADLRRVIPS